MELISRFNKIKYTGQGDTDIGSAVDVVTYDKLSNPLLGMMNGRFNDIEESPANLVNDSVLKEYTDINIKGVLLSNSLMQFDITNDTSNKESYAYITYIGNSKVMILNLEPAICYVYLIEESNGETINSSRVDVSSIGSQSNRMLVLCESPNEVNNISLLIHENYESPHCNASIYVMSTSELIEQSQLTINGSRIIHSSGRILSDQLGDVTSSSFTTSVYDKWESSKSYSKNSKVRFINLLYIGNKKSPNNSFPFHLISYSSRFSSYQNNKLNYYESDKLNEYDAINQLASEYKSTIDKGNYDKSPITYSDNNAANNVTYDGNTMTYELIDNTENKFNWKRLWIQKV
jgi:hypothetical protein